MLEKLAIGLVVGLLQFLAAQRAQKSAARAEVYRELAEHARKAYEYEIDAVDRPDGGGTLRVRYGAPRVKLPSDPAHPGDGTA